MVREEIEQERERKDAAMRAKGAAEVYTVERIEALATGHKVGILRRCPALPVK